LMTRFKGRDRVKSWGREIAKTLLPPQGLCGGGVQAGRDHARHVERRNILLSVMRPRVRAQPLGERSPKGSAHGGCGQISPLRKRYPAAEPQSRLQGVCVATSRGY
jgi:hypothetical protein